MRNYFIEWDISDFSSLNDNKGAHFYALEQDGVLQYLGLSYGLVLTDEIAESMKVFDLDPEKVTIWTGQVIRNIHNTVDQQLAEEIICLLVYNLKPKRNVICKRSYYGRDGLEVHNRGAAWMPEIVRVRKEMVSSAHLSGLRGFAI